MSWQKFVDDNLIGANRQVMKFAGIFGQDGNPWAISAGFNANPQEVKTFWDILKFNDQHFTDGVYLMGQKYTVIRVDSDTGMVIRRKVQNEQLPDEEKYTAIVCTTNQAVVIGVTTGSQGKANMCSTIVGNLQTYLKSTGY